jgi:pyrroline-5-carboxylate reductase
MGSAIASCLLDRKTIKPADLLLYDPESPRINQFKDRKAQVLSDLKNAVIQADAVLLAVKPQIFPTLLPQLKKIITPEKLIISIAAGIPVSAIKKHLRNTQPVVRVMPNLCAMVGESMSVWVKSPEVSAAQEKFTREILQSIGKEVYLEKEDLINAATAVSGSGPAYVFYLTEILEEQAREFGFSDEAARLLSRQTIIGSAKFLQKSDKSPKELRLNVTSKGGTTEAAFDVFTSINLRSVFNKGIRAALKRARELTS